MNSNTDARHTPLVKPGRLLIDGLLNIMPRLPWLSGSNPQTFVGTDFGVVLKSESSVAYWSLKKHSDAKQSKMAQHGKGSFWFRSFILIAALFLSYIMVNGLKNFSYRQVRGARFEVRQSEPLTTERSTQGDQYLIGVGKADITG